MNGAGELGDGTFEDRHVPVKVQQLGGRVIKLFVSSVSDLFLACVAFAEVTAVRRCGDVVSASILKACAGSTCFPKEACYSGICFRVL